MPRSITQGDVFLAYFNKIWGIPFGSVTDMLTNHSKDTPNGVVITDGNGDTITLVGITVAQLQGHPSLFHFV
jgi:hypothetical protein